MRLEVHLVGERREVCRFYNLPMAWLGLLIQATPYDVVAIGSALKKYCEVQRQASIVSHGPEGQDESIEDEAHFNFGASLTLEYCLLNLSCRVEKIVIDFTGSITPAAA